MSTNSFITRDNRIIRENGLDQTTGQGEYFLEETKFDIDGALIGFKVNGAEFIYIDKNNFHNIDKSSATEGFCLKTAYEDYKTHKYIIGTLVEKLIEEQNWFNSHFETAKIGDVFQLEKIETSADKTDNYTKYYLLTNYKFKIINLSINFFDETQYPFADSGTLDPSSANYSVINTTAYNRLNKSDGLFFSKNFGDKILSLNIEDWAKKILYKSIIKICFELYWISEDKITDILAIKNIFDIESRVIEINIANQDNPETLRESINNDSVLSKIDKIIANLILDWGLIGGFDIQIKELIPDYDGDETYAGLYQPFEKYLTALTNFHSALLYYNEIELFNPPNTDPSTWDPLTITIQSNKRLEYIADVFPPSALSLLSSYEDVKRIIENYLNLVILSDSTQDYAIKLINSLTNNPVEGDKFLKYLLDPKDGQRTKFEVLLFLFDKEYNGSINGRTQVGNLIFPYGRRKEFCQAILNLWRKSNFNPNYNKGNQQYNPNFYFTDTILSEFKLKNNYGNPNSVIELGSVAYTIDDLDNPDKFKIISDTRIDYAITPLQGQVMQLSMAYSLIISQYEYGQYNPDASHSGPDMTHSMSITSSYHLFQPVTLIAYKEGEPLLSQEPVIPAFLFYVAKDIENMKKLEEKVYFAAEISLNILLFFALGGAGILEQIIYLRYITNIGRAVMAGAAIPAGDVVLVLKAGEGIAEVVTMYGITASQYHDYLAETALTEPEKAYQRNIARVYFYITLLAAGGSMALRWKANELASEAVTNTTYYNALPSEVKKFIGELGGYETKLVDNFRQKIEGKTEITSVFDNLSPVQKKMFAKEFNNLTDTGLQNMNYPDVVNNWSKLYLDGIEDRTILDVIKNNSKVDNITNFYLSYNVRQTLKSKIVQKRWSFLNEFQPATVTQVGEFKNDFQLINSWERFRFEPNLIDEYKKLTIGEKIEWFKSSGTINTTSMEHLKLHPKTFNNWKNLSIEDRLLFKNLPDAYVQSIYQFDDFIFFKKFSPVEIPNIARDFPSIKPAGYLQVEFRFTENGYKWEVRAHTEIPNSPGVGNGDVWVVRRQIISDGTFQPYQEFLSNNEWIRANIWFGLIEKQTNGTITEAEKLILKNGHFKIK